MGYNLSYSDRNAGSINVANYSTAIANAGVDLGIPLNEFDRINLGFDARHTKLKNISQSSSLEIQDFVSGINFKPGTETSPGIPPLGVLDDPNDSGNGTGFFTLSPSVGWTHDTLNRALFPSSGGQQRLSGLITLPGISDLEYFKLNYKHQEYFPLSSDFTFRLLGEIGYGDGYGDTGRLPFFENYYGGGTGSVRGFRNNTIGPKDTLQRITQVTLKNPDGSTKLDSKGKPITVNQYQSVVNRPFGGSTKILGSAELFFPVPFLTEVKSVRLGTFFDAGSIQDDFNITMKYSVGISGEWLSPFGALSVSAAYPLNAKSNSESLNEFDQKEIFQFNFGQNF